MLRKAAMVSIADDIIKDSYRGKKSVIAPLCDRPMESLRSAVAHSKRFVLDESMSEFLAVMSNVPFIAAVERQHDVWESLRHSAILPFPKIFVQFDNVAFRRGLLQEGIKVDFWGDTLLAAPAEDTPEWAQETTDITKHIAYLLEQDASDENLVWITEFTSMDEEGSTLHLPMQYAYRTDDSAINPRLGLDMELATFGVGITGVGHADGHVGGRMDQKFLKRIGTSKDNWVTFQYPDGQRVTVPKLVPEFGGIVRYVLSFIALLTDSPKLTKDVRPAKGYMAGGRIRKYQDHTVLTLNLPRHRTMKTLANRIVVAARRGWHEVIPHWRVLTPKPGQFYCASREQHLWTEKDSTGHANCTQCDARRVHITLPHGRGDPTISIRTHKYVVTHKEN
jgi:hypothetical protein